MRAPRLSLVSTASQKTLTYATKDSQPYAQIGYYAPHQNQRRFARKNNNPSIGKNKNRSNFDQQQDNDFLIGHQVNTPKQSKQKSMTLCKSKNEIQISNKSINKYDMGSAQTGSFKLLRTRQSINRTFHNTIRISQEKQIERISGISVQSRDSKNARSNNVAVLNLKLELKQKELIVLEDERRKFRKSLEEMKRKECVLQQRVDKCEAREKQNKERFEQNICDLQKQLERYVNLNRVLEYENNKLKQQFCELSKEKTIVEKQLFMFLDKKVPKNIKQLQSCRQMSLQNTINDLKVQLNMNKTSLQLCMEQTITKLRHDNMCLVKQLKNMEIVNRLLQKRACDSKEYLQANTIMKQELKNMKQQYENCQTECDLLRMENVRMKQNIKKMRVVMIGRKSTNFNEHLNKKEMKKFEEENQCDDNESLNLSLSTCSR